MKLRCTLMGFEINYQIKIPSKQLINNFSTKINPNKIAGSASWFLTGSAGQMLRVHFLL